LTPTGQKVGVFGGAFDPPHNAHVTLATTALAELALDALHVIPTGKAWHKARTLSPAADRLAMTRLAFQDIPRVVVDDREIKRAGPSFTIDTLRALQTENPSAQLYLIMGADQFAAFKQWHQWQEILQIAIICIAGRTHFDCSNDQFDALKEHKNRILTLPMPPMAVSATQIRQLLAGGLGENQGIADLLPNPVASYIAHHQLYQAS
jgi:nicotinate-nucleotide adenylyltransferase